MKKIISYFKCFNLLLIAALCFMFLNVMSMAAIAYQSVTTTTTDGNNTHTTKTVERSDESRGLIGSTFHLIGQVLIFPFKVIGSIF